MSLVLDSTELGDRFIGTAATGTPAEQSSTADRQGTSELLQHVVPCATVERTAEPADDTPAVGNSIVDHRGTSELLQHSAG